MTDRQQEIATRIAVIKLKRIQELNTRIRETLKRERIPTSSACLQLISHIEDTPDYLIPYLWSLPLEQNKFARYQQMKALQSRPGLRDRSECCTIM
ncbi:hypothetical protein G9P44_000874 [Scheffersomyces stipitis]|nr:hypothetical protein G9P44_000874 [Scheffersomyces stipitis]